MACVLVNKEDCNVNNRNFFVASEGIFLECDTPDREPDYISMWDGKPTSMYWFEDEHLIRKSDHWFQVGFCYWIFNAKSNINFLPSPMKALNSVVNGEVVAVTGRVSWDRLYWADNVNPNKLIRRFVIEGKMTYLMDDILEQYYI